jgi:hypothetical protein
MHGAFLIAIAALVASPALAAAIVPAHECRLEAWVVDRDPAGLNVRSAPSREARLLGTLPPLVNPDGERDYGVELRITGAKDGWLRIEGARDDPSRNGLGTPRPTYAGTGWISGNLVRFGVQSAHGYAQPDVKSERRVDLGQDWLSDRAEITRMLACKDDWAHVEFRLRAATGAADALGEPQRAWFRGICANQETTCDRAAVD